MTDNENKPSWRDLDLARDRGVKLPKRTSKAEERENRKAAQKAKSDLQKLFANSKLSKEKEKRLQDVLAARGTSAYQERIQTYVGEFGIPVEWDAQLVVLDSKNPDVVIEVLDAFKKTMLREPESRQQMLKQKLRVLNLSTFDSRILDKLKEFKL